MRAFKDAVAIVRNVFTRGLKKFGKKMLISCRGHMDDVGQGPRFQKLLREAHLPEVVEDIPTDDEPEQPEEFPVQATDARWSDYYRGDIGYEEFIATQTAPVKIYT